MVNALAKSLVLCPGMLVAEEHSPGHDSAEVIMPQLLHLCTVTQVTILPVPISYKKKKKRQKYI